MINAIYQSSLNMALRCGEQFRRRYLEDHVLPPGIAAGRGTGVHNANEVNLKQKIRTDVDLPISDMQDAARDGFVKAFEKGIYLPKDELPEKDKILNEGLSDTIRLTELYGKEVAPKIKPKDVEVEFNIDVGLPLNIAGKIDIQRENKLDDLKTTKKTWSEGQINKEIQPILYSFVHEYMTGIRPRFDYQILIALKNSTKLQIQSITPTNNHYRALFTKFHVFCDMIDKGVFMPANPSSWWCCEKWCGYYLTCPYVGNQYPTTWI